jgi:hypothetical protein
MTKLGSTIIIKYVIIFSNNSYYFFIIFNKLNFVASSGNYHSAIHLWEGGYDGPEGKILKDCRQRSKIPIDAGT